MGVSAAFQHTKHIIQNRQDTRHKTHITHHTTHNTETRAPSFWAGREVTRASGKSRVMTVLESGSSLMLTFEPRNVLGRPCAPKILSDTGRLDRKTPRRSSPTMGFRFSFGTRPVAKRFVRVFGGANVHTDGRASLCVLTKISFGGWRDTFKRESISRMRAECDLSIKRRACKSVGKYNFLR
jgi:hypothetical protein